MSCFVCSSQVFIFRYVILHKREQLHYRGDDAREIFISGLLRLEVKRRSGAIMLALNRQHTIEKISPPTDDWRSHHQKPGIARSTLAYNTSTHAYSLLQIETRWWAKEKTAGTRAGARICCEIKRRRPLLIRAANTRCSSIVRRCTLSESIHHVACPLLCC